MFVTSQTLCNMRVRGSGDLPCGCPFCRQPIASHIQMPSCVVCIAGMYSCLHKLEAEQQGGCPEGYVGGPTVHIDAVQTKQE